MPFRSGKSRFWSKPREGKGEFAATPNLAPVARRVAACGPLCGLVGRRWGTDTSLPFGRVLGSFSVRRKRSRRKALTLFRANAGYGSPQRGLPRGFAGF